MVEHLSKFTYDISKYKWKETFQDLYGIENLEEMHRFLPEFDNFTTENDSWHLLYRIYYSNFQRFFKDLYLSFLPELLDVVGEPFYYQKIPCVRFGLPRNKWLTKFHTDSEYNHPQQEINFNLAITKSEETASLQIEDRPNSNNYISLTQNYGEYTCIDHIGCKHGSIINNTNHTLISIDFRLLPASAASKLIEKPSSNKSVLVHLKFRPGEYFSSNSITNNQ